MVKKWKQLDSFFQAKSILGLSPSLKLPDITDPLLHVCYHDRDGNDNKSAYDDDDDKDYDDLDHGVGQGPGRKRSY